jgi:GAF domain-containing protein
VFKGAEFIIYSSIYAALLIITFAPLPYPVKAGALILAGYFVGTYTILQYGPWTGAIIYHLGITLFASLLFDKRLDRWVAVVNIITIIVISVLNLTGQLALGATGLPTPSLADWLSYGTDYIVFVIALTWAINLLKDEFKSVADQFQSALAFLSKDRSELEKRVDERTAGYIKKTEQLRAASYIARQTADIQDLEMVLNMVVNLVTDQFGYYHAGIFLMNEYGDEVVLQTASSEGGKRMVARGHSFKVGAKSIVGYSASQKKPRIALDVGNDAVFFNNPDLPNTRSEMALPLLIHDKVLGILDIQSDQPQAFSVDDIDVLQILADQIAVAIENMRLLEDAQTALMQIETLTVVRTQDTWRQKVREGNFSYTYTPLGMRSGKISENIDEQALLIPITLRGQKIGSISLTRKNNAPWNDVDIDMVNEVAYQTGLAIDNVRLVEEATERARQEQTVGELATRFSQSSDIDNLLQTAARELGQVTDVAEVSVYIGQIPEQSPQKRRVKRFSA